MVKENKFSNTEKQEFIDKYSIYIVLDTKGNYYVHSNQACNILDIEKSNLYKLFVRGNLKTKEFGGGGKFVELNSLLKERKIRIERFERKQKNLLNSTGDVSPEWVKKIISDKLSVEQIEEILEQKKKSKK